MAERNGSDLFVNDGSFMEKFKKLQQEKQEKESGVAGESKAGILCNSFGSVTANATTRKIAMDLKLSGAKKSTPSASNGKLAFNLKQKSKLITPVMLGEDDDDNEGDIENVSSDGPAKRQKLGRVDVSEPSSEKGDVAPPPPSDIAVKNAADKLASFVAKNGRQFEHITRQKNPGDSPFKFLFDKNCLNYKYYEYRLMEEEKLVTQAKECNTSAGTSASRTSGVSRRNNVHQHINYQIPASALYEANIDAGSSMGSAQATAAAGAYSNDGSNGHTVADPIALMEFYMKKAAREEHMRQPKQSKDEMPPPASFQASVKRGHHMGDYIPPEELEKFLSKCNDAASQRAAREAAERAKIQADNIGHKLLSKMGWREGEGLGSSKSGRSDPVMAGDVKMNNLGVGAEVPGEVTPDDDMYEQYKKRMMLGYRYRPNPLNNPRKAYY